MTVANKTHLQQMQERQEELQRLINTTARLGSDFAGIPSSMNDPMNRKQAGDLEASLKHSLRQMSRESNLLTTAIEAASKKAA